MVKLAAGAALVAIAVAAAGCGSGDGEPSASSNVSDAPEALTLTEATRTRIAGDFVRAGQHLSFEVSTESGSEWFVLRGAGGRTLVEAKTSDAGKTLSLMDGALTYTGSPASGAQPTGDASALAAFVQSDEGSVVPWLSRALGARGITAAAYPSSFIVHSFGLMFAQADGIALPPVADTSGTLATQEYYADNGAYCAAYPSDWGPKCEGMCGPGCNCWSWICGDCCEHDGCLAHDRACRACSWTHPGDCVACASFSAFFSGGGCGHG